MVRAPILRDEPLVVVLAIDGALGGLDALGGFLGRGLFPSLGAWRLLEFDDSNQS
jgi:hypothetical protein